MANLENTHYFVMKNKLHIGTRCSSGIVYHHSLKINTYFGDFLFAHPNDDQYLIEKK